MQRLWTGLRQTRAFIASIWDSFSFLIPFSLYLQIKKRVRDNVRGSGKSRGGSGANSQSLDDSEGDTDDDDDGYGSQDRRSEMGRD